MREPGNQKSQSRLELWGDRSWEAQQRYRAEEEDRASGQWQGWGRARG